MLWNWYLCSTVSIFFRTNNFVEKLYDAWMTTRKMYACVWVLMSFTHKVANSLSCFSIKAKVNKQLSDRNLAPFACYYMRAIQYFRWLCFSEVTSLTVWMARIAAIFPAALGHVFIPYMYVYILSLWLLIVIERSFNEGLRTTKAK